MHRRSLSALLLIALAFVSVGFPRDADGFLMLSAVAPTTTTTPLSLASRKNVVGFRRRTINGRRRTIRGTRLFSTQTSLPPTEQEQPQPAKSVRFNAANFAATTRGPDPGTKPDYENIHGPLGKTVDAVFLYVFRTKLAENVGVDSSKPKTDYGGLIELTAALNARYSDRNQIQSIAQKTLQSLFPGFILAWFPILFARPFPEFSCRMNAWATYVAGQWLMGECEVNDVEIDGKTRRDQGLLVKRCRFLEESGCASVCVNSCKIPTQNFFIENMGLPLTMTPDYETHECQFAFGRMPTARDDLDAMGTPCLSRCPTAGSMRRWHNNNGSGQQKPGIGGKASTNNNDDDRREIPFFATLEKTTPPLPPPESGSRCVFMENPTDEDMQQIQP